MNQVAHKVVPAIVTNNRMVLKPSEKVPFSAIVLADVLYEAGLPPRCSRSSPATRPKSPTSC
jgi:acyl-CoA reductase-like NAD-dependent aldehyde dehydrogenase